MRNSFHMLGLRRWSRRRMLQALAIGWMAGAVGEAAAATVARERRPVGSIREVETDGPGELLITQGTYEELVIEAEPRLLPRITARVEEGVLRFDYGPDPIMTMAPIRFLLTVREVRRVELAGSGSCAADRLDVPRLALAISGSGDMSVADLHARELSALISGAGSMAFGGEVERQRVVISGSGDYQASGMASRAAEVVIEGSGTVELAASERLDVHIGGSGSVRYRGRPRLAERITGAGTVEAMDES